MHQDYVPAQQYSIPADGFVIEFPDVSRREAGDLAKDLKLSLDNAAADAGIPPEAKVEKVDPNAQDPGTIIAIILGAKATVAIATGIALWMRRKNQGRIRLRFPDGTKADISGTESHDIQGIVRAISKR
jgi:hypothetical protein